MALAFNAEQRQKELKPIRMPRSFYRGGGRLLAPRSWSPPKIFRSIMRQFCGRRRKLFRILVLGCDYIPMPDRFHQMSLRPPTMPHGLESPNTAFQEISPAMSASIPRKRLRRSVGCAMRVCQDESDTIISRALRRPAVSGSKP